MPAPTSRRRDPFRPPGKEERRIELATCAETPVEGPATLAPPASPSSATPAARKPVEYRRPGISWVTVVVLGFAAVGVAAVGGVVLKKVTGLATAPASRVTPETATRPVIYKPLSRDDAVLVHVQVSPREARLMLDGEPLVSNPVRLPRGPKPHTLAATAEGYAPTVEEFTADAAKTVRLRLPRARR
jgi:hypothetical protein